MKLRSSTPTGPAAPSSSPALGRRDLVIGAGVAGAAALTAAALHRQAVATPEAVTKPAAAAQADGYQVTPHVLRYYETTRS